MGSAGHAFVSHTKGLSPGAQTKDGGYGPPPHPVRVFPGMRFWTRRSRHKRILVVSRVAGDLVQCRAVDGPASQTRVTARVDRVLAVGGDGQGLHYRFAGYASRQRGYRTVARLIAIRDGQAMLCLPEWHPSRPAWIFADLVPGDAEVGDWLSLRAHLDAPRSGHLRPTNLSVCPPPLEELAQRALVDPPTEAPQAPVPPFGPDCGDIVVCVPADQLERLLGRARDRWDRSLYVHRNRPPARFKEGLDPVGLPAGAGVWLVCDGRVRARASLAATEQNPNGTLLFVADGAAIPRDSGPESGHFHGWRWRWWTLA